MNINESNAPNGAAVNPAVPEALISKLPDRSRRWSVSIPYSAKKNSKLGWPSSVRSFLPGVGAQQLVLPAG